MLAKQNETKKKLLRVMILFLNYSIKFLSYGAGNLEYKALTRYADDDHEFANRRRK